MRIAYFDCSSGISGDMCLGALVDAGVSLKKIESELRKMPIKWYRLEFKKVRRAGFRATKVDVVLKSFASGGRSQKLPPHPPLSKGGDRGGGTNKWKDIEKIIKTSSLSDKIKQKGLRIFRRLFEAEAKVHGETFNNVHLHELGAVDCIVDIFGTIIGLEILGIEKVYSSPVNVGGGFINTAHGIIPAPAPATLEILRCKMQDAGCKIYSDGTDFELTTPTGAAILREMTSHFGNIPQMTVERIGIGAGAKDFKDKANVLRIFVGDSTATHPPIPPLPRGGGEGGVVAVIETNIDDMNPQVYEHVMEKLFKAGAFDVYLTQIIMKKGRPGIKLTVLCGDKDKEDLMKIILEETTTIGLRFYEAQRKTLNREIKEFDTKLGKIRFKVSRFGNKIIKMAPEYEDCKKLARKLNIPLIEVMKKASLSQH